MERYRCETRSQFYNMTYLIAPQALDALPVRGMRGAPAAASSAPGTKGAARKNKPPPTAHRRTRELYGSPPRAAAAQTAVATVPAEGTDGQDDATTTVAESSNGCDA